MVSRQDFELTVKPTILSDRQLRHIRLRDSATAVRYLTGEEQFFRFTDRTEIDALQYM